MERSVTNPTNCFSDFSSVDSFAFLFWVAVRSLNQLTNQGTLIELTSELKVTRWAYIVRALQLQSSGWELELSSCHWCWRDWVYRSKWAFVSRWCWPAIGSCNPKCCMPIAWEIFLFREAFLFSWTARVWRQPNTWLRHSLSQGFDFGTHRDILDRVMRSMTWPTKRQWQRQRQWQIHLEITFKERS